MKKIAFSLFVVMVSISYGFTQVDIPIEVIEAVANTKIPAEFSGPINNIPNGSGSYHVTRGHISLSMSDDGRLHFSVPIRGHASAKVRVLIGDISASVDLKGTLKGAIRFEELPDGKVRSHLEVAIYLDDATIPIKVSGRTLLRIPVKPLVEPEANKLIRKHIPEAEKAIDEAINK